MNFGYQGMVSIVDSLVDRNDVIVYDSEAHACIIDGARLHMGKRFVYPHNNIDNLKIQLNRARKMTQETGGGILVITEGVFGMTGDQGKLKEIVELKKNLISDCWWMMLMVSALWAQPVLVPTKPRELLMVLTFILELSQNQWQVLVLLWLHARILLISSDTICVHKPSPNHFRCRWYLVH